MVAIVLICLALIIALLPIVMMRKVKESLENKQREDFYNKCRILKMDMSKNEVISILGNNYTFNCDIDGEYYCWVKKVSTNELACIVTFKNEHIVKIEME